MFKVKLAVAAAMFVAVGAFASNFRVADQVYVPAAGHIVGGSQLFISDVFISNLRRKLEAEGEPRILHTKRGAGYVIRAPRDEEA